MIQLDEPHSDVLFQHRVRPDDKISQQVMALIGALYPQKEMIERRHEKRYPFPHLIHVTPVGEDGVTPEGDSIAVVGKHLSRRGLGFYHPKPLPYRKVVISLERNGHWLGFLVDLKWCRFTKQGWYESGGRFLQSVPSPIENAAGY